MISCVIIFFIINFALLSLGMMFSKILFERILFINSFNNHIIILICLISLFQGNSSFIDIALIYALLSFIPMFAILKKYRDKKI